MRFTRIGLLGILLVGFGGCASRQLYEGPSRSSEDVSIIRAWIPRPATGAPGDEAYDVRMIGVDDHEFDDYERNVEVLPGRHKVHLRWKKWVMPRVLWATSSSELIIWQEVGAGQRTMEIEVEAGKKYRLIVPWETAGRDWYFEEYGPSTVEH